MRVYVAGRVSAIPEVREVQIALIHDGHTITFDWTGPEGEQRKDWSSHPERAWELAQREVEAVQRADVVVLVGKDLDDRGGLGCFLEVGVGIASGAVVFVLEPTRESIFWYLPGVHRVADTRALLKALERYGSPVKTTVPWEPPWVAD